jgi:hypothetical protein
LTKRGVVGEIVLELDLACSGMLLGKKSEVPAVLFLGLCEIRWWKIGKNQFPPLSTRTMRFLVPGKR